MKKTLAVLLVLLLVSSLGGCGFRERLAEKAGEEMVEDILDNYTSANVEIDGDHVTIEDEEGNSYSYGGSEWPTSDLAKAIPEFTSGTILTVMDGSDGVYVYLEEVEQAAFETYLDTIKGDFTGDTYEATIDGTYSYGGTNGDGVSVSLVFAEGTLSITVYTSAE